MKMENFYLRRITLIDNEMWHYLDRDGCWYLADTESQVLLCIPAEAISLQPTKSWNPFEDEYDVCEVSNLDEDQSLLDDINNLLGSKFTMNQFPGR